MNERDDQDAARSVAADFVDRAPRTVAEVERRLRRGGFDPKTVEAVIADLVRAGLLDDRAFALAWVESRSRSRKLGRLRLDSELRRKGVPSEVIAEALATIAEEDAISHARSLAQAFLGSADIEDARVRQRLAGYLLRRGHAWDTIEQVLLELRSKEEP